MTNESYLYEMNKKLISNGESANISSLTTFIHSQFKSLVMSPQFPCAGAKTAFSQGTYRFGVFDQMGCSHSSQLLAESLKRFVRERPQISNSFSTFVACFKNYNFTTQNGFTQALWNQLQMIHENDSSDWDPSVSSNPEDANFSFSFEGCAFFVIGMHAGSARWARRFAWPTLVFNAHEQFERLREKGEFVRFRDQVRKRDVALQGSYNPILEDHGNSSEARQYSGENLSKDWKCPFKHKKMEVS